MYSWGGQIGKGYVKRGTVMTVFAWSKYLNTKCATYTTEVIHYCTCIFKWLQLRFLSIELIDFILFSLFYSIPQMFMILVISPSHILKHGFTQNGHNSACDVLLPWEAHPRKFMFVQLMMSSLPPKDCMAWDLSIQSILILTIKSKMPYTSSDTKMYFLGISIILRSLLGEISTFVDDNTNRWSTILAITWFCYPAGAAIYN